MCICVVVVHSLSCIQLFATPWTVAHQAPQSSTISRNLFKFMSTESVMPSNHLILCPSFSFCPQSFPASSESIPHQVAKVITKVILYMHIYKSFFLIGI